MKKLDMNAGREAWQKGDRPYAEFYNLYVNDLEKTHEAKTTIGF
jgi:hypothetical protein